LGLKNQSFRNKSGKAQPIRTKFGIHGHVKGWQHPGNFGHDRPILGEMGAVTNPAESEFFCVVIQRTFQQLRNGRFSPIWSRNVVQCPVAESGDIFETFHFRGHLPPKIWNRSNRHLTQSRLQVTRCIAERYCLLHVVVQGPGSFQVWLTFFYDVQLQSYGASMLPNFSDFGLFSPYKTPKTYLPVTSLQPRGYIAEWFWFFHVVVEGPKGCLPGPQISCNFW